MIHFLHLYAYMLPTIRRIFLEFFLTANFENLAGDISDLSYAKQLVEMNKIATIPLSSFYKVPPKSLPWVRFAFCKKEETLKSVAELLLNL